MRNHGVQVVTLNRQRPSRHKKWMAPNDKVTHTELARYQRSKLRIGGACRAR